MPDLMWLTIYFIISSICNGWKTETFVFPKSPFASMCDSVSGFSSILNLQQFLWFYITALNDLGVTSKPHEFLHQETVSLAIWRHSLYMYFWPWLPSLPFLRSGSFGGMFDLIFLYMFLKIDCNRPKAS